MPVTHLFVSAAPPSPDPAKVGSAEWNAGHVVDIANADVNVAAGIVESKLALNFPTHAQVSLDVNVDTVLSLAGQTLGLDVQTANRVFAGPSAGIPAVPTFRALVASDIPALPYGDISGTGVVGQVAEFVTNTKTLQAAKLIGPAVNILTLTNAAASTLALNITSAKTLTLTAADDYNLTIPATGTAALLGTANVFTVQQMVDGASDQIQFRVQANATQTANLQTWEDSAGNVVGYVDGRGVPNWNIGTDASNTFIGYLSGKAGATKTNNVGVGKYTLQSLTSGDGNLCMGAGAGAGITTSNNNVFIGTSSGYFATGAGNMGLGGLTFLGNSFSGSLNAAVGFSAGHDLSSASRCIFIGPYAGYRQTTTSYLLIVDSIQRADAATEASNAIIYGVMAAAPANQTLNVNAVLNVSETMQIDGTQVITNRVIDDRIDDTINSGDATTDGVIDAIRDALITHGLIAAA